MTVSSRTPEGQPSTCPLCQAHVAVEPSILIGDATCPCCGHLLWFLQTGDAVQLIDAIQYQPLKNRLLEVIASQLGLDHDKVANNPALHRMGVDSLDLVELVMELEDQFYLDDIPPEE